MRNLALLISSFGFISSLFLRWHSPLNLKASVVLYGLVFLCLILMGLLRGAGRYTLSDLYGGCPSGAYLIHFLLVILALQSMIVIPMKLFNVGLLPAFYWMVGCGIYSAPAKRC